MAVQYAFGKIVTQGLDLNVDAADPTSYPGSGTSWTSVVNRSITGSVISCSFSSDFKGGIVFNNPSASVVFPGTVANYGTGSFTIEMAFRPDQINGIHYLISKNSGSYPNWGVYLSGSGGSGKLVTSFQSSSIGSGSVVSTTNFTTGSTYDIFFNIIPNGRLLLYVNGQIDSSGTGNTYFVNNTDSYILGNYGLQSTSSFSGSIFSHKVYALPADNILSTNFNFVSSRLGLSRASRPVATVLVVGAGGRGSTLSSAGGGGGGGGVVLTSYDISTPLTVPVVVGLGSMAGNNGGTSSFGSIVAQGGGRAGGWYQEAGLPGGSGGGGGLSNNPTVLAGGTGSIGQGFSGGVGDGSYWAGGGGGATSPGLPADKTNLVGGSGGNGYLSNISGTPVYYGGGGAARSGNQGGPYYDGLPGLGGGAVNQNGTDYTGAGGGGGAVVTRGGHGVVIIRYPGPVKATGGTITTIDQDIIHTFTSSGDFTVF